MLLNKLMGSLPLSPAYRHKRTVLSLLLSAAALLVFPTMVFAAQTDPTVIDGKEG